MEPQHDVGRGETRNRHVLRPETIQSPFVVSLSNHDRAFIKAIPAFTLAPSKLKKAQLHHAAKRHSTPIQRAYNSATAPVEHMRVDHGRRQIGMTKQFLNRADIRTRFEQMRGKAVA